VPSPLSAATRIASSSTHATLCLASGRTKPFSTNKRDCESNFRTCTASALPRERLMRHRRYSGSRQVEPAQDQLTPSSAAWGSTSMIVSHSGSPAGYVSHEVRRQTPARIVAVPPVGVQVIAHDRREGNPVTRIQDLQRPIKDRLIRIGGRVRFSGVRTPARPRLRPPPAISTGRPHHVGEGPARVQAQPETRMAANPARQRSLITVALGIGEPADITPAGVQSLMPGVPVRWRTPGGVLRLLAGNAQA
jgi:hypothetical protein